MPFKEYLRHQYGGEAVKLVNDVNKLEEKLLKAHSHLTFLLRCRDKDVIPNGLSVKSPVSSPAAQKTLRKTSKLLLRERIQFNRKSKQHYSREVHELHTVLQDTISEKDYALLKRKLESRLIGLKKKFKERHLKKFHQLLAKQETKKTSKVDPKMKNEYLTKTVYNLSSTNLTEDQIQLLSKGLKFIPNTQPKHYDDFIAGVEKGLRQLAPGGRTDYLRHQITDILMKGKRQPSNLTTKEKQALKELKSTDNITIVAADKGKATVVLDTNEYKDMVLKLLEDKSTYRKIRKDPTNTLETKVLKLLNEMKNEKEISTTEFYSLKPDHPTPPYARATIKIHKNPIKARLLICSIGAPLYNVSKYLSKVLAPLGKTAKSFIQNSCDLCERLKEVKHPTKIVSYDVVDLFTNVPRNIAITALERKLQNFDGRLDTKLSTASIIQLVKLCLESTYFTWDLDYYEQLHGLPMGSPLSPLMTEIFMESYEENLLSTAPFQPITWLRKVDDTLVLLDEDQDPNALLDHLNSQSSRIRFTMEEEVSSIMPFLDIKICKGSNTLTTSVYRKPTHTNQYIHFLSNHSLSVKTAVISSLTQRAIKVCHPHNLDEELLYIKGTLCHLNGYPERLVKRVILQCLNQRNPDYKLRSDQSPVWASIPFIGTKSYHIKRLLEQNGIRTFFKSGKTVKDLLGANGKSRPEEKSKSKGCVYKITCSCDKAYIGESKRPLIKRIKEHQSKRSTSKSAIVLHIKENPKHKVDWEKVEVLAKHLCNKKERKLQEAIQIRRHKPELNFDEGIFLPKAYDPIIRT